MPQSSTSTGLALMKGALRRRQPGRDIADVGGDVADADGFAAGARFHALEIEHRRQRMAAHADQRTAAGHGPLRGMRGMRAAVALLGLHEQDLVLVAWRISAVLATAGRIDPVFGIHEELAAFLDRRARSCPSPP